MPLPVNQSHSAGVPQVSPSYDLSLFAKGGVFLWYQRDLLLLFPRSLLAPILKLLLELCLSQKRYNWMMNGGKKMRAVGNTSHSTRSEPG